MKRLVFLIFWVVPLLYLHSQLVYAGQVANVHNLTLEDVQTGIQSFSRGGIRVQSNNIEAANIDQDSIKVLDVHQEGNTAFVYCNFTDKKGEKFFGYIPLLRLKNSTTWINRDNGIILEK